MKRVPSSILSLCYSCYLLANLFRPVGLDGGGNPWRARV